MPSRNKDTRPITQATKHRRLERRIADLELTSRNTEYWMDRQETILADFRLRIELMEALLFPERKKAADRLREIVGPHAPPSNNALDSKDR